MSSRRIFTRGPVVATALLVGVAAGGCSSGDGTDKAASAKSPTGVASSSAGTPSPSAPTSVALPATVKDGYCGEVDVRAASSVLGVALKKSEGEPLQSTAAAYKGATKCSAVFVDKSGKATGLVLVWAPNDNRPLPDLRKSYVASLPGCTDRDAAGFTPEQAFQLSCAKEDFRQDSVFTKIGGGGLECRHYTNAPAQAFPDADAALASCLEQLTAIS